MKTIVGFAPAKVNLSLDIVGVRENGYHEMDMVMQAVSLGDTITIETTDTPGEIRFVCDAPNIPCDETNLAVKAARLFLNEMEIQTGLCISLVKRIPSGAGMAGGSADAACVLFLLNRLFACGYSLSKLCELGVRLGADVPFCLCGGTARVQGIGERISPLAPLSSGWIAGVKPPLSISTKEAFAQFDRGEITKRPDTAAMVEAVKVHDLAAIGVHMENVFEQTCELPVLHEVKAQLLKSGACGAVLTGSGSVIYGLFSDEDAAHRAQAEIASYGDSFVCRPIAEGPTVIKEAESFE